MKVLWIFLGILLYCPLFTGPSGATGRIQCDAVKSMAEVEADLEISVVVAKDPNARTCVFYVSLPPGVGQKSAIQETSEMFKALIATPDEKLIGEKFVPLATQALLFPLSDPRLDKLKVQIWSEALTRQKDTISACTTEAIWKKGEYRRFNDVISCGIADEGTRFVVEANLDGITLAFFLPIT